MIINDLQFEYVWMNIYIFIITYKNYNNIYTSLWYVITLFIIIFCMHVPHIHTKSTWQLDVAGTFWEFAAPFQSDLQWSDEAWPQPASGAAWGCGEPPIVGPLGNPPMVISIGDENGEFINIGFRGTHGVPYIRRTPFSTTLWTNVCRFNQMHAAAGTNNPSILSIYQSKLL